MILKKILILANNDVGLYNFRKELIEELLKENEVHISLPYGKKVEPLKEMGCHFIETQVDRRGTNIIKDGKLLVNYIKTIRKINPDVVLTYTIKPNIYGGIACSVLKIPFLVNITGIGSGFANGGFLSKLTTFLYKISLKKASCVFFQNRENKKLFDDKRLYGGKSVLIPGSGVNLQAHSFEEYIQTEKPEILYVGRIMKEKGMDEFINAAEAFVGKSIQFSVVGMYDDAAYKEKIEKENIIKFYGQQTDVHSFMKNAQAVIMPSYHEGMSNVLLEASACGRVCLCSDIPGCREIVDDGETGFLFEAKNSESLIEAVEKFIALTDEEKIQMGINARKKVEKEFDRNIVIDAYIKEIDSIRSKSK